MAKRKKEPVDPYARQPVPPCLPVRVACQCCGEIIPRAYPRHGSSAGREIYLCDACYRPCPPSAAANVNSAVERIEIDYHGDRFEAGEW